MTNKRGLKGSERAPKLAVEEAAQNNWENCSGFAAEVSRKYLPTDANGKTPLDGKQANEQIQYIARVRDVLTPGDARLSAIRALWSIAGRLGAVSTTDDAPGRSQGDVSRPPIRRHGHIVEPVCRGNWTTEAIHRWPGERWQRIARSVKGQQISYAWRANKNEGETQSPWTKCNCMHRRMP